MLEPINLNGWYDRRHMLLDVYNQRDMLLLLKDQMQDLLEIDMPCDNGLVHLDVLSSCIARKIKFEIA
jgi:hypothetical protein